MRIANLIILTVFFMVLGQQDLQGGEPYLDGRWKQLSNQKDLTGWEVVGAGDWTMERVEQPLEVQRTNLTTTEGEIVVRRRPGEEAGGWLVTRGDYADFILRLKVAFQDCISGSQFRLHFKFYFIAHSKLHCNLIYASDCISDCIWNSTFY